MYKTRLGQERGSDAVTCHRMVVVVCLFVLSVPSAVPSGTADGQWRVAESSDIAPVWSGHPVGFSLLTHGDRQFVAFYDAERRMTVASRRLKESQWHFVQVPQRVGWDSHNSVTMAMDGNGELHLSGNMHGGPLVYFRMTRPYDVGSLERFREMVGRDENRCTYPHFFTGPGRELIFTYRDGGSGNGDQIYNIYDSKTRTWARLIDQPLISGQGLMNAYPHGPVRDRNGVYHLCWVWRDTPDCATNHDLSYARSRDLRHWETSRGTALKLPITLDTADIVDAVPVKGGMINGNTILGFDSKNRPVISYHKFDSKGHTQLQQARLEADGWKNYQTTQWSYRWEFGGGGSIPFEIRFGPVRSESDGRLTQSYHHIRHGSGTWVLDEQTLRPTGEVAGRSPYPRELRTAESTTPGMEVQWQEDLGASDDRRTRYVLRWETLGRNRDRARENSPEPAMLRLYQLEPVPPSATARNEK